MDGTDLEGESGPETPPEGHGVQMRRDSPVDKIGFSRGQGGSNVRHRPPGGHYFRGAEGGRDRPWETSDKDGVKVPPTEGKRDVWSGVHV